MPVAKLGREDRRNGGRHGHVLRQQEAALLLLMAERVLFPSHLLF